MAQFYGTVQGMRGEATRMGSKNSGIQSYTACWAGAVRVDIRHEDGEDIAVVELVPWKGSGGDSRELYRGALTKEARAAKGGR